MELSFKTGDTVMIYGEMDEDGFFSGEIDGRHGLVPSNFLAPAPVSEGSQGGVADTRPR